MRILILNRVEPPAPGATGRLVAELSQYLRDQGHTVQAITAGKLPPRVIPYVLAWLGMGLRALFSKKADCVLVMTDPPMLSAWIPALRWRHGRVVHWCQDLYPDLLPLIGINLSPTLRSVLESLKRWSMKHTNTVIAIGRCMADKLKPYMDPAKIVVIPNWTEQNTISPLSLEEEGGPKGQERGVSASPTLEIEKTQTLQPPSSVRYVDTFPFKGEGNPELFHILYAGNLGRAHPVEALAEAISACVDLPVHFTIMASGQGENVLHGAVGQQPNVSFLPPQTWEVAQEIQNHAHLHMVALRPEATGLAVPVKYYAALRCRRPIVFLGSSEAEAARHIAENHCGDVLTPADAQQFANLIRLYADATGRPTAYWQSRTDAAARAADSLPDSLSMVAAVITKQ